MKIDFTLNNKHITLDTEPTKRLVDAIRDDLSLTGTKIGCEVGECGACTVVIDGEAVTSCLVLVGQVQGKNVLTIEGLSELEIGRILQKCFVENGAVQCGFCTPGMLMSAYALLNKNQNPSKEEIKEAMSGNLCRCTGYVPILNSIEKAKDELKTLSKK
ncbi:MAG: (2Fe-2S)-binding protein [Lachnospiraceae bacterium]|nr:(2Fe-2S)-binding protein [Lachnospiraceae bacterium]